jgi:site-specific DNA-methyltransferase (adenine-specific)
VTALVVRGDAPVPYYADDQVTLYHGDCREITEWLAADVLVTDPPYGIAWRQDAFKHGTTKSHPGIAGDEDTTCRDGVLAMWGDRTAAVFGALAIRPPTKTKQVLIYHKPSDSGTFSRIGGFRRDVDGIFLLGLWPDSNGLGGRSSILSTGARMAGGKIGIANRSGHPHAKPLDVLECVINACPPGVVADPFAGSGSTLIAARNVGREAIGVEIEERYCEIAARRLSQGVLDFSEVTG